MLKKLFYTFALCAVSLSLCSAELPAKLVIDPSTKPASDVEIEKTADGFVFDDFSSWKNPVSFNPADAEIALDVKFDLTPAVPHIKRKYNGVYTINDAKGKRLAILLIVQYPGKENSLLNFTAYSTDGKFFAVQTALPIVKDKDYSIAVKMNKDHFLLTVNGKIKRSRNHTLQFNAPAEIILGSGNKRTESANMTVKKFVVKSN